jgi:hypothetical protein
MYLIVIEAAGADSATFHYQPYRLANSMTEAFELMRDYMRLGPETGALVPEYFAVYSMPNGVEFGEAATYFDPCTFELKMANEDDLTEWLQQTGRI